MQRLVASTYFRDFRPDAVALAGPLLDADLAEALPPTLIVTAELDALRQAMDALAVRGAAEGFP